MESRLAVVDLGSNSFRLVVFTTASDGWWQRTDEIYEPVRIGEGLAASGRLAAKPIARALATLDVFAHFCRASGLQGQEIDAVATSAIRDAENSTELLDTATERSGLSIRVLSREQEARYGYLAAVNSTTLADGCVMDLGGGSLQLVRVRERRAKKMGSWPLGAVRMSERFALDPDPARPADPERMQALREYVAEQLAEVDWLRGTDRIVGLGGAARNLAVAAQRAAGLPSTGVQGFLLTRKALGELIERLAAMPAAERAKVPGIKPARADLILAGALAIEGVLLAGGLDGLEVTEAGLREGVFFERHLADPAHPDQEPLFDDVRREGVMNLARRYAMDAPHSRHVAELALHMFDELAELGLHPGEQVERELLWAACMLHDIGMSVDYDDHHKHSRYLILNAGLPGFAPVEVAVIAQAARYHRKGMPDPGSLAPLFGKRDRERLARCATLLRLAEDLERSRDQLVTQTSFAAKNGTVRLQLSADGDTAVPRWAARREGELFERAFGRDLEVCA
ncbi:MAG TPA: Ppx/GppA phosphatase family protein [Solirubrobacteraceae bacterium]|jgi:exopolyphosphatase/guanosine-5'-triphosphate,3'-diphosphate pyrophosphatase